MSKADQLIEAWERLIESLARKEGLSKKEAEKRAKRFFPELYHLYRDARKEKGPPDHEPPVE